MQCRVEQNIKANLGHRRYSVSSSPATTFCSGLFVLQLKKGNSESYIFYKLSAVREGAQIQNHKYCTELASSPKDPATQISHISFLTEKKTQQAESRWREKSSGIP